MIEATTAPTEHPLHQASEDASLFLHDIKPVMKTLKWLKWILSSLIILVVAIVGVALWIHDVDAREAEINRALVEITANVSDIAKENAQSQQRLQEWKSRQEETATKLITLTSQMHDMLGEHEKFILMHGWPDPNHPH